MVFKYDECIACRASTPTELLMPCGHKCLCRPCLLQMRDNLCPICRRPVLNIREPLAQTLTRVCLFTGYWGTIVYFSYCWYSMIVYG